jgi:hypothetical protein
MLTRWAILAAVLAGCASAPAPRLPPVEKVAGPPAGVRMLLDAEEAMRITRVGVMDPASPSGLTDRFRYRAALGDYIEYVLRAYGLCPRGYANPEVAPAQKPFDTLITVECLPS